MRQNTTRAKAKRVILPLLSRIGYFALKRCLQKDRVTVLMYHRFSNGAEPFKITNTDFERQIRFLKNRYSFISLNHFVEAATGRCDALPRNPLILTIDDGFEDNYHVAFPVLKKYNIPATIFLVTDFIGNREWIWGNRLSYILEETKRKHFTFQMGDKAATFHVDTFAGWHQAQLSLYNVLRFLDKKENDAMMERLARQLNVKVPPKTTEAFAPLTWDQIREMKRSGIDFGSHTCSHAICSRLNDEAMLDESVRSKANIEHQIGESINCFCYPNGQPEDIDAASVRIVEQAGYAAALTTINGHNSITGTDLFRIKRISPGTLTDANLANAMTT